MQLCSCCAFEERTERNVCSLLQDMCASCSFRQAVSRPDKSKPHKQTHQEAECHLALYWEPIGALQHRCTVMETTSMSSDRTTYLIL